MPSSPPFNFDTIEPASAANQSDIARDEIKACVKKHIDLTVSMLYIAQVKQ